MTFIDIGKLSKYPRTFVNVVFECPSSWKDRLTLTNWNGQKGGDFLLSRVRWMGN